MDRAVDRGFISRAKALASLGFWTPGQKLEKAKAKPTRRVVWHSKGHLWFENERRRRQNEVARRRRRNVIAKASRRRNRG